MQGKKDNARRKMVVMRKVFFLLGRNDDYEFWRLNQGTIYPPCYMTGFQVIYQMFIMLAYIMRISHELRNYLKEKTQDKKTKITKG